MSARGIRYRNKIPGLASHDPESRAWDDMRRVESCSWTALRPVVAGVLPWHDLIPDRDEARS